MLYRFLTPNTGDFSGEYYAVQKSRFVAIKYASDPTFKGKGIPYYGIIIEANNSEPNYYVERDQRVLIDLMLAAAHFGVKATMITLKNGWLVSVSPSPNPWADLLIEVIKLK